MKNKKRFKIKEMLGLIGILTLIATISIYAITRKPDGNTSQILGFCFMIFSEIILFVGFIGIENSSQNSSKIITRIGCGSTLTIYSLLVFLSSWMFMLKDTEEIKNFWVFQIILFSIATTLIIIFYVVSRSVYEKDKMVLDSVSKVNEMVDSLKSLEANEKYGLQFSVLAENLSFTDISSSAEVDNEIEANITKIELMLVKDENAEDVEAMIEKIAILIKKRKVQVRNQKVGGL